jgi:hypothetical protein
MLPVDAHALDVLAVSHVDVRRFEFEEDQVVAEVGPWREDKVLVACFS